MPPFPPSPFPHLFTKVVHALMKGAKHGGNITLPAAMIKQGCAQCDFLAAVKPKNEPPSSLDYQYLGDLCKDVPSPFKLSKAVALAGVDTRSRSNAAEGTQRECFECLPYFHLKKGVRMGCKDLKVGAKMMYVPKGCNHCGMEAMLNCGFMPGDVRNASDPRNKQDAKHRFLEPKVGARDCDRCFHILKIERGCDLARIDNEDKKKKSMVGIPIRGGCEECWEDKSKLARACDRANIPEEFTLPRSLMENKPKRTCSECLDYFFVGGGCDAFNSGNADMLIPKGCHHCGPQAVRDCGLLVDMIVRNPSAPASNRFSFIKPAVKRRRCADCFDVLKFEKQCDRVHHRLAPKIRGGCHHCWPTQKDVRDTCVGVPAPFILPPSPLEASKVRRSCRECLPYFYYNGGCAALKQGNPNMPVPKQCYHCGGGAMEGCGFLVSDVVQNYLAKKENRFTSLQPAPTPRACKSCFLVFKYEGGCDAVKKGNHGFIRRGCEHCWKSQTQLKADCAPVPTPFVFPESKSPVGVRRLCKECLPYFHLQHGCTKLKNGAMDMFVPHDCDHCGPHAMRECGFREEDITRNYLATSQNTFKFLSPTMKARDCTECFNVFNFEGGCAELKSDPKMELKPRRGCRKCFENPELIRHKCARAPAPKADPLLKQCGKTSSMVNVGQGGAIKRDCEECLPCWHEKRGCHALAVSDRRMFVPPGCSHCGSQAMEQCGFLQDEVVEAEEAPLANRFESLVPMFPARPCDKCFHVFKLERGCDSVQDRKAQLLIRKGCRHCWTTRDELIKECTAVPVPFFLPAPEKLGIAVGARRNCDECLQYFHLRHGCDALVRGDPSMFIPHDCHHCGPSAMRDCGLLESDLMRNPTAKNTSQFSVLKSGVPTRLCEECFDVFKNEKGCDDVKRGVQDLIIRGGCTHCFKGHDDVKAFCSDVPTPWKLPPSSSILGSKRECKECLPYFHQYRGCDDLQRGAPTMFIPHDCHHCGPEALRQCGMTVDDVARNPAPFNNKFRFLVPTVKKRLCEECYAVFRQEFGCKDVAKHKELVVRGGCGSCRQYYTLQCKVDPPYILAKDEAPVGVKRACTECLPHFHARHGCDALKRGDPNMFVPHDCHHCGATAMQECGFLTTDVERNWFGAKEHRFTYLKMTVKVRECKECFTVFKLEGGCTSVKAGIQDLVVRDGCHHCWPQFTDFQAACKSTIAHWPDGFHLPKKVGSPPGTKRACGECLRYFHFQKGCDKLKVGDPEMFVPHDCGHCGPEAMAQCGYTIANVVENKNAGAGHRFETLHPGVPERPCNECVRVFKSEGGCKNMKRSSRPQSTDGVHYLVGIAPVRGGCLHCAGPALAPAAGTRGKQSSKQQTSFYYDKCKKAKFAVPDLPKSKYETRARRECTECLPYFHERRGCDGLRKGDAELFIPAGCHHCGPQAMQDCGYLVEDVTRNNFADPEHRFSFLKHTVPARACPECFAVFREEQNCGLLKKGGKAAKLSLSAKSGVAITAVKVTSQFKIRSGCSHCTDYIKSKCGRFGDRVLTPAVLPPTAKKRGCNQCMPYFHAQHGCDALKRGDPNMFVPPGCNHCGAIAMRQCGFLEEDVSVSHASNDTSRFTFLHAIVERRFCETDCFRVFKLEGGCGDAKFYRPLTIRAGCRHCWPETSDVRDLCKAKKVPIPLVLPDPSALERKAKAGAKRQCSECLQYFHARHGCDALKVGASDMYVPPGCSQCGPSAMKDCGYLPTDVVSNHQATKKHRFLYLNPAVPSRSCDECFRVFKYENGCDKVRDSGAALPVRPGCHGCFLSRTTTRKMCDAEAVPVPFKLPALASPFVGVPKRECDECLPYFHARHGCDGLAKGSGSMYVPAGCRHCGPQAVRECGLIPADVPRNPFTKKHSFARVLPVAPPRTCAACFRIFLYEGRCKAVNAGKGSGARHLGPGCDHCPSDMPVKRCARHQDWALSAPVGGAVTSAFRSCNECLPYFHNKRGCEKLKSGDATMFVPTGCHHCGPQALTECGLLSSDVHRNPEVTRKHRFTSFRAQVLPRACDDCFDAVKFSNGCAAVKAGSKSSSAMPFIPGGCHHCWADRGELRSECRRKGVSGAAVLPAAPKSSGSAQKCGECLPFFLARNGCADLSRLALDMYIPSGCRACGAEAMRLCGLLPSDLLPGADLSEQPVWKKHRFASLLPVVKTKPCKACLRVYILENRCMTDIGAAKKGTAARMELPGGCHHCWAAPKELARDCGKWVGKAFHLKTSTFRTQPKRQCDECLPYFHTKRGCEALRKGNPTMAVPAGCHHCGPQAMDQCGFSNSGSGAVTASPEQKPQNRFDYLRPLPADRPCALCKEVFKIENGCELLDKQLPLPLRPGCKHCWAEREDIEQDCAGIKRPFLLRTSKVAHAAKRQCSECLPYFVKEQGCRSLAEGDPYMFIPHGCHQCGSAAMHWCGLTAADINANPKVDEAYRFASLVGPKQGPVVAAPTTSSVAKKECGRCRSDFKRKGGCKKMKSGSLQLPITLGCHHCFDTKAKAMAACSFDGVEEDLSTQSLPNDEADTALEL